MGGSDPVDVNSRVEVWLETIPVLLRKVNVEHVTLFCHSAGTIYLLNTLHSMRRILDPRAPAAMLMAPWVTPGESHALYGQFLSLLPKGIIQGQEGVGRLLQKIAPSLQWSSNLSAGLIEKVMPNNETSISTDAEKYGCDEATARAIARLSAEYIWAEDTKGFNEESFLCLRKTGPEAWLECQDYAKLAQSLAQREAEHPDAKLSIKAYFAENDVLVGEGGRRHFETCFSHPDVASAINFESSVKAKTNHDSIVIDHKLGPLKEIFEHVSNTHGRAS